MKIMFGKSELLISIAESWIETKEGNILLLAPSNSVRDELSKRMEKYGVDHGIYDWNKRINVFAPKGFVRSKEFNEEAKSWLADVLLCISDECHNNGSASYVKLFDELKSLMCSYGFSASPDSSKGNKLCPSSMILNDIGSKNSQIIGYCGTSKIIRTSPAKIRLVVVKEHISNKEDVLQSYKTSAVPSWIEVLDHATGSENMSIVISNILNTFNKKIFYIPIHKKETGLLLYNRLIDLGYNGIFWTGDEVIPELDYGKVNEKGKYDTLGNIKEAFKQDSSIQFLMSTTVGFEGIDIPTLNGVIPLTGANYRMTLQPVGRSARGSELIAVMIYDLNNKLLSKHTRSRYNHIKSNYEIIETKRLENCSN